MSAKYTIEFNSGGNHGHQLKDYLGGRTIGELYNLEYIATPYKYLSSFGVVDPNKKLSKWKRLLHFKKIIRVNGPNWDGFDNYQIFRQHFENIITCNDDRTLYVFENALRVHPCQTIAWKQNKLLKKDVFSIIQNKISSDYYCQKTKPKKLNSKIRVVMHINRGQDYDKIKYPEHFSSSKNVRYMFPMSYYAKIINQIQSNYEDENIEIEIFTEALNSEGITEKFGNWPGIELHIGRNRTDIHKTLVSQIFHSFVDADILVCSNSSFSSVAAYFRKNKTTIYHPHKHLFNLPEPEFIPTSINGEIDIGLLPTIQSLNDR